MSVVVVGSANVDLVYTVASIPAPGETVLATGGSRHPGGKGANQAIAAARAGAATTFVALLGDDDGGALLRDSLRGAGVVDATRITAGETGTALITVDARAENTIVVNSGANALFTSLTDDQAQLIRDAELLVLQLEIPLETVRAAAAVARAAGTRVLLNAAPVRPLPSEVLALVDVLIVNETEAAQLAGDDATDLFSRAQALTRSVPSVIITLGSAGSILLHRGDAELTRVEAHEVEAVDTTGAGDTFCGALASALDEGLDLASAARFATAASALSVQRAGAVPSIPHRKEIDSFVSSL
ncbi:ribokinase [Clavibacter michiganensis]|nr:ribokinase [Clavibacter michiganensis]PPF64959.1 ribokinase [Clavibacter michiganensis]